MSNPKKISTYFYRLTLVIVLLLSLTSSLTPDKMDHNLLQKIKQQQDYTHHFIFFNQQAYTQFSSKYSQQLVNLLTQRLDVRFYLNDCQSVPMKQCESKVQVPLVMLFNRIFIRFNGGASDEQTDQIHQWILLRINAVPVTVNTRQQLEQQLRLTPQMFCYCKGENKQQPALFFSLSKAMILADYCILENSTLYAQLGLKQGNLTMFKNGTIQHRLEYQYPNRYDLWEMFSKINCFNHVQKGENILKKRFAHQNKNINTTIVICDLSFKCEQFWRQFKHWSKTLQSQSPQIQLALTFFDHKQILLYNIYLATKLNYTQFPALLHVNILSENGKAGWLRRYEQYYLQEQLDVNTVRKFISDVNNQNIKQIQLSGPLPAKNGFTGKNAEKLIQKVVAANINQTIANSQKHYLLLLSTFGVGCNQCQQFYKQYRKAASLLSEEDITFGYMDVLKNEVRIDNVKSIPQVLLFNKYFKQDPVVMTGRENFDSLLRFLENNAIINYTNGQL